MSAPRGAEHDVGLAFRGILDGRSSTVWSGMIKVDPGAQQIDASRSRAACLRSRGLRLERAKRLVIEGFLEATVERFQPGFVRVAVAGALERRLEAVLGA